LQVPTGFDCSCWTVTLLGRTRQPAYDKF
jgi:hypothetical protein